MRKCFSCFQPSYSLPFFSTNHLFGFDNKKRCYRQSKNMLLGTFSVHCTTHSTKSGRLAHIWPIGKIQQSSAVSAQGSTGIAQKVRPALRLADSSNVQGSQATETAPANTSRLTGCFYSFFSFSVLQYFFLIKTFICVCFGCM